jgi:hypothetical protein
VASRLIADSRFSMIFSSIFRVKSTCLIFSTYSPGTRIGIGRTPLAVPGSLIAVRPFSIHSAMNGSGASANSSRTGNVTSSGKITTPADASLDRYCAVM